MANQNPWDDYGLTISTPLLPVLVNEQDHFYNTIDKRAIIIVLCRARQLEFGTWNYPRTRAPPNNLPVNFNAHEELTINIAVQNMA